MKIESGTVRSARFCFLLSSLLWMVPGVQPAFARVDGDGEPSKHLILSISETQRGPDGKIMTRSRPIGIMVTATFSGGSGIIGVNMGSMRLPLAVQKKEFDLPLKTRLTMNILGGLQVPGKFDDLQVFYGNEKKWWQLESKRTYSTLLNLTAGALEALQKVIHDGDTARLNFTLHSESASLEAHFVYGGKDTPIFLPMPDEEHAAKVTEAMLEGISLQNFLHQPRELLSASARDADALIARIKKAATPDQAYHDDLIAFADTIPSLTLADLRRIKSLVFMNAAEYGSLQGRLKAVQETDQVLALVEGPKIEERLKLARANSPRTESVIVKRNFSKTLSGAWPGFEEVMGLLNSLYPDDFMHTDVQRDYGIGSLIRVYLDAAGKNSVRFSGAQRMQFLALLKEKNSRDQELIDALGIDYLQKDAPLTGETVKWLVDSQQTEDRCYSANGRYIRCLRSALVETLIKRIRAAKEIGKGDFDRIVGVALDNAPREVALEVISAFKGKIRIPLSEAYLLSRNRSESLRTDFYELAPASIRETLEFQDWLQKTAGSKEPFPVWLLNPLLGKIQAAEKIEFADAQKIMENVLRIRIKNSISGYPQRQEANYDGFAEFAQSSGWTNNRKILADFFFALAEKVDVIPAEEFGFFATPFLALGWDGKTSSETVQKTLATLVGKIPESQLPSLDKAWADQMFGFSSYGYGYGSDGSGSMRSLVNLCQKRAKDYAEAQKGKAIPVEKATTLP